MKIKFILALIGTFCLKSFAQEILPIYSDYLSDNVFLVHPSAAGIGNCAKFRITHRQQWSGVKNAPSLQTLSYHQRIGEKAALGGIIFNDKNGFHSQKAIQASYAYHINFGAYDEANQLSLGLSLMYVQNTLDERSFIVPDPVVSKIVQSAGYVNSDFSAGYHYWNSFAYFTVKNLLLRARTLQNRELESLNLRRYLFTIGHYFGKEKSWQFEPSIMGQWIERTGEKFLDVNLKVYKNLKKDQQLWAALSYRKGFDGKAVQDISQITPIIGFNYKRYMISYTYTEQLNDITFQDGGHHQFTIGVNLFCKRPRAAGCPNLNTMF